jgi:DNA-binding CsgD family transcriptional regulator
MLVSANRIQEGVDSLLREPTPNSLLDHMKKVMEQIGVEHFLLLRFTQSGEKLDEWVIGSRLWPQWITNFKYRDDPQADPIIQYARTTVEPFFWTDIADEERLKHASSHKVPEGLVVPVPGPYGCVGVMWMGGRTRDELRSHGVVIQAIGLACYYHLQRYCDPTLEPAPATLTKKERVILTRVANGLSAPEIAVEIHISNRTVDFHVAQAMKKLHAKNRIQAVVLAIRDGLIPFEDHTDTADRR